MSEYQMLGHTTRMAVAKRACLGCISMVLVQASLDSIRAKPQKLALDSLSSFSCSLRKFCI